MVTKRFTQRGVRATHQISALWAGTETVFGVILLAAVLSFVLPAPPLGDSFVMFYASGFIPLGVFVALTAKLPPLVRQAVRTGSQSGILIVTSALFHAVFAIAVLGGIYLWSGAGQAHVMLVAQAIGLLILFSAGMGAVSARLALAFARWPQIWNALLRPIFLLSGAFFLVDDVPDPFRDWLAWNPLVHVISMLRAGLYPYYTPALADPLVVAIAGLTALACGLMFLDRGVHHAVG